VINISLNSKRILFEAEKMTAKELLTYLSESLCEVKMWRAVIVYSFLTVALRTILSLSISLFKNSFLNIIPLFLIMVDLHAITNQICVEIKTANLDFQD